MIIEKIIIHCADTLAGMDIGAAEIREWHTRERGWRDIGYHYVIRRNGVIEKGRADSVQGAHTKGQNANSLGICLVGGAGGECNFTGAQWAALSSLVKTLQVQHAAASVHGHNEFSEKQCPCFDARAWAEHL